MSKKLAIDFIRNPLVPAVIIDNTSGEVLMIAFMNEDAYRRTRETGRTHFWSRSRNKLWKKGETSGHEQIVRNVSINCEDNALLIAVDQIGAVCHTGHPTCFYRDIEDDESLTVTTDRAFDPDVVYGQKVEPARIWYGALEWLKAQPLESQSSTSRLLKSADEPIAARVSDELRELAGVIDGTHRHEGLPDDLLTEGSQSLYWLALAAIHAGLTWDDIRPDRALDTTDPDVEALAVVALLRSTADEWSQSDTRPGPETVHAAMAIVAQAARSLGIDPVKLIEHDLAEMRTRVYLRPWFDAADR